MSGRIIVGEAFNPYHVPKVRRIVRASKELSAGAKLVFDALVDRAGDDGRCFPGVDTIAEDIGLEGQDPRRHARRFIRELELAGYCRREPAFDSAGRQTSNRFAFRWRPEYDADGRGADLSASPNGPILSGTRGAEVSGEGG